LFHGIHLSIEVIVGIFMITIAVVIAAYIYYFHVVTGPSRKYHDPSVFVLNSQAYLRIIDKEGKIAEYKKTKTCRSLVDGFTGYTETFLRADGKIKDIRTGGSTHCSSHIMPDGRLVVDIFFTDPLQNGDIYEMSFSCVYCDSFMNEQEYFGTRFIFPTEKYQLTIEFPAERPVRKAWLEISDSLESDKIVTDPEYIRIEKDANTQHTRIIAVSNNPNFYSKHTVRWNW